MDYKACVAALIADAAGIPADEAEGLIEVPQEASMGDYALPCFTLARTLRKAPPVIAAELKDKITPPAWLERVENVKGYLNFFIDRKNFAASALKAVASAGARYGGSDEGAGRTVCIDYSSINIAKPFHIGHLSTTAIGHSLYRIYAFMGYRPVGINHLGDWGTQFGKLIVAFRKWGDRDAVESGGIHALTELYVRFHDEAERDPALEDEARAWFRRIEHADPEATALFNWFKELTLRQIGKIYDLLGIRFDSYAGESFYNDKMDRVVDELTDKGILVESDGARIVDLSEWDMPPCLILKSDGATLYATRDIAAALYRKDTYDFARCLYVVASHQSLHFAQFFKVIELMGYPWAGTLEHVAYGMVSLPEGAMSTRRGRVVWLEEIFEDAIEKARAIIEEKNPDLPDAATVARQVGVGAVVFAALKNNRIKDIVFSRDAALNFDGETAPYVQYTHARCCSLIEKAAGFECTAAPDPGYLINDEAQAALKLVASFPAAVSEACRRNEPYIVTRHIVALSKAFNKFYFDHRILDDDRAGTHARLALVDAVRHCLFTGLHLIGVEAPERM
ncbi:MAG: arginine--tRNA ligase [Clostridiales bacterium]|nr:arginine--tRNA ligase [Clostridiales bacterium]